MSGGPVVHRADRLALAAVAALTCALAAPAFAQPTSADFGPGENVEIAHVGLTAAVTATSVDGTFGSAAHVAGVSEGGSGAPLSLGAAVLFDLRIGRALAIGDFTFGGLSGVTAVTEGSVPGLSLEPHGSSMSLDSLIGFRLVDRPRWGTDAIVGVRIIRVSARFIASRESDGFALSESWGDGVLGVRLTAKPTARLSVDGRGTAGGEIPDSLGASTSWQIDAGAAYQLGRRLAAVVRYKRLHAWRQDDVLSVDFDHSALIVGVRFDGTFRPGY